MSLQATDVYAIVNKKLKSVLSGYDHAEKTGDNTMDIYFTDGSKIPITIPLAEVDYDKIEEMINAFIENWLEENKDSIKGQDGVDGKDGNTVFVGKEEDAPIEAVLIFDPDEVVSQDNYTKTQADVRFAKSFEVGDVAKLVVSTWKDLVDAINTTFQSGMGGYNFVVDENQKTLTIITRGGTLVPIDISQIILNTNIEEFKDMLVTNILDGQSLVWSASKKKWINKSIDSSGMLVEAKAYTDEEIKKFNNKGSLAVDEKPTYYGGIITYKQGGVTKTTDNAGTWFYYFDENSKAVQTIFIEGTEFTIAMAGDINLDDYIAQTEKADTYDDTFTDKTKVPTTRYIEELKGAIDDEIADKVNTTDIEDSLTSNATDKPLSANQGKVLSEGKLDKIDVVSEFTENPTDLEKVPNLNWISGLRNVLLSALGKKVDKEEGKSLVDDTEIERLADVDNYDDTEVKDAIDELNVNLGVLEGKVDTKISTTPAGFFGVSQNTHVTMSDLISKAKENGLISNNGCFDNSITFATWYAYNVILEANVWINLVGCTIKFIGSNTESIKDTYKIIISTSASEIIYDVANDTWQELATMDKVDTELKKTTKIETKYIGTSGEFQLANGVYLLTYTQFGAQNCYGMYTVFVSNYAPTTKVVKVFDSGEYPITATLNANTKKISITCATTIQVGLCSICPIGS